MPYKVEPDVYRLFGYDQSSSLRTPGQQPVWVEGKSHSLRAADYTRPVWLASNLGNLPDRSGGAAQSIYCAFSYIENTGVHT